jgi:hypothetical protein
VVDEKSVWVVTRFKESAHGTCTQGTHKEFHINAATATFSIILYEHGAGDVMGGGCRRVKADGTKGGKRGLDE